MPEILRPFLELARCIPGSWHINAFALYAPWRSRGIGARLLAAATERARDAGCRQMSVQTFSETPRSEAFHIRHGFRRVDPASSGKFAHEADPLLETVAAAYVAGDISGGNILPAPCGRSLRAGDDRRVVAGMPLALALAMR